MKVQVLKMGTKKQINYCSVKNEELTHLIKTATIYRWRMLDVELVLDLHHQITKPMFNTNCKHWIITVWIWCTLNSYINPAIAEGTNDTVGVPVVADI